MASLPVTIRLGVSTLNVNGSTGTWFYHPSPQHIYNGGTPAPQPLPQPTGSSIDFDIGVVYIYMLEWSAHEEESELPLEALALSGYLGNKPFNPSLAISIKKPSFSVKAFTKVVCDLYLVSLTTTTLPSEYKLIVFRFHINEAITQHWGMHLMCILLYYEVWISKSWHTQLASPQCMSSMHVQGLLVLNGPQSSHWYASSAWRWTPMHLQLYDTTWQQ